MAPSAVETVAATTVPIVQKGPPVTDKYDELPPAGSGTLKEIENPRRLEDHKEPLKTAGVLDQFSSFDVTPVIGREFPNADLARWLRAPNSDELLRDLAITSKFHPAQQPGISERGVVFFRKQDDLTDDLQKELVQRLGELTGKPKSSGLHIHPVNNGGRHAHEETGKKHDDEISTISSVQGKKLFSKSFGRVAGNSSRASGKHQWHSDITFEPVPSDYALLKLTQLPKTGGDTLWASGYELYDRISPPLRAFLDTLTAYYAQPNFNESAKRNGFEIWKEQRGAPDNVGEVLEAIHPLIRTNPVTGWKSVFGVGHHVQRIHGLTDDESRHFLDWFTQLIVENHELQVRYRWENVHDIAIWDNRSVYHAATPDYVYEEGLGERSGNRAVSLGEKPYFDPASTSRREALAKKNEAAAVEASS